MSELRHTYVGCGNILVVTSNPVMLRRLSLLVNDDGGDRSLKMTSKSSKLSSVHGANIFFARGNT